MIERNPILDPVPRLHQGAEFSAAEVGLANRNSGIHLEMLAHEITPLGMHYLLSHFDVPYVQDASGWRLNVGGEVEVEGSFSLADLQCLPLIKQQVMLECAGNGRALVSPRWPSQPWCYEAVGNAEWTGCRLRDVLTEITLKPSTKELVFSGADRGVDGGVIHFFERSLSLAQVLDLDVMIVWEMNGQSLLPQHGFPLRLIVPGWYGMASVKWLQRITAIDHSFGGYQQLQTYRYRTEIGDPGTPITGMKVKSLMIPPGIPDWLTRRRLTVIGTHDIYGRAWSGHGCPIVKVEIGVDGSWMPVHVEPQHSAYAWQSWRGSCEIGAGQHELSCRATDANGHAQPLRPVWDQSGMGNNSVQRVEIFGVDKL